MKFRRTLLLTASACAAAVVLIGLGWAQYQSHKQESASSIDTPINNEIVLDTVVDSPIQPIRATQRLDARKVALGEMLFHDARLSADNTLSCASCHNLAKGGDDGLKGSVGVYGAVGDSNSPTVFNASLNITQFWDGRAKTLFEQIEGPIHHPKELGTNWNQIIGKIGSDTQYLPLFVQHYEDGITADNIKDAIVSFEQSLLTNNSPFDRYLLGDAHAVSELAQKGYEKFKEYGCIACHQGQNVGGNMYQPLGVMGDYFKDRGTEITQIDLGRFNVTGREEDKFVFRVPSLRLASLTAPYFHDGSADTLTEAVQIMIKYQVGRTAEPEDVAMIIEFINSLVGEYKGKPLSL